MNVTIQGVTVAYYPDYSPTSQLWKVHLRDAFRIVTLADTECFVKRFASKPRAWAFMVESKGKRLTGLPIIYEAKSAVEDGKRVYYLILEKIEGDTLHDLMKSKTGGKASVSLMGRALATAFRTVHAQGYWHADFCAKNIMVSASGRRFVMIDLDSLEPNATRPTPVPNEPGYLPDQELAIYALTYVQSYVEVATKSFGAIPGPTLNLLQLVFLLDKLIYFSEVLKPKGTKFRDLTAFKELPHLVHQTLGAYTDHLAKRILAQSADSEMIITQPTFFQKELLPPGQTIAWAAPSSSPPLTRPAASVPAELVYFQASRLSVLPTQSTQLTWKVNGVSSVEISGLGIRPAESSFIILHSDSLVGEQTYMLTAAGGTIKDSIKVDFFKPPPLTEPSLPLPPAPTAVISAFRASSYSLKPGEQTVLSWKVTGVVSVYISGIGTVPAAGAKSFNSSDFSGRVEFEVTAGTPPVKKSFFIEFPAHPAAATAPTSKSLPTIALVNFSSTAQNVMAGQAVELSWEVSGAASVHITQLGTLPAKGRYTIQHNSAIVGEQLYTLTVVGTAIKKDINVRFLRSSPSAAPPQVTKSAPSARSTPQPRAVTINSFTADSYSLIGGGQTEISWDVSGAPFAHISNIGIVSSKGFKTFNSKAFKGKVEFVLTAGIPAVKRSFFIDFPGAPAVSVVHAVPVVPAVPVTSANLYPSQYLAQAATNPPTAKAPVPVAKSGKSIWLGILSIIFLIGGGWAYSRTAFTPNQVRGLQQFDREEYDSSFVNLIKFRDDTSHHFATQYNLAFMYDRGRGTDVNNVRAVELYKECLHSTTQAVASNACYALGWCYLSGEGCLRDTAIAKRYFSYAANQYSHPKAKAIIQLLEHSLQPAASSTASPALTPVPVSNSSIEATIIASKPFVKSRSPLAGSISIEKISQLEDVTRVDFKYMLVDPANDYGYLLLHPPGNEQSMHIECAGSRYSMLSSSGISTDTDAPFIKPQSPQYFSVYFRKIPVKDGLINIVEGGEENLSFYGVQLGAVAP